MTVIYETINLVNQATGVCPWRYIGSDQNNNPEYLGSSETLQRDIAALGRASFVKRILEECGDISNRDLRMIETEKYLKPLRVRTDETFYNKVETYSPGCGQKGMKHSKKFPRTQVWKDSRKGHIVTTESRKLMATKKIGTHASKATTEKMSTQRAGSKNANALAWTVVTPFGATIHVTALRTWAKNNGHNFYDIYHCRNGWAITRHGAGKGGGRKNKEQVNGK
jgi:hypothetical protein